MIYLQHITVHYINGHNTRKRERVQKEREFNTAEELETYREEVKKMYEASAPKDCTVEVYFTFR